MIRLTDAAISHASQKATAEGKTFIRVGVKPSGCSGYEYVVDWADEISNDDFIEAFGNFKVVINPYDKAYLKDATIDFVREGLNSRLKILNPLEKATCGCGVSVQF